MSTSLTDLLDATDSALAASTDAGAAAHTLMIASRVLSRLVTDGIDRRVGSEREAATEHLISTCSAAAEIWPASRGRTSELLGAVGDTCAKLRTELTQSDRWAVARRTATIARRSAILVASTGPYERARPLHAVVESADKVRRLGAALPPDPARCMGLARQIPVAAPFEQTRETAAAESFAQLYDLVLRQGRPLLSIRQMITVCRVAEQVASRSESMAGDLDQEAAAGSRALAAWAAARMKLALFTDGTTASSQGGDTRLIANAARAHEALARGLADGTDSIAEVATHPRAMANQLPQLADALHVEVRRHPSLIVPLGAKPLNEHRVGEWLRQEAFLAAPADLAPASSALLRAAKESAKFAAGLDEPERALVVSLNRDLAGPSAVHERRPKGVQRRLIG
jgi:hypothetical protein